MKAGHLDVGFRGIHAHDLGAEPRHRFAQKPAAAADVEDAQAFEGIGGVGITPEMGRHLVADIGQPDGVELVQRTELAVRVPPFGGQRGKAFHLVAVDGGAFGLRPSGDLLVGRD